MFYSASAFNQNIGGWNVARVSAMSQVNPLARGCDGSSHVRADVG
jgi:surface protein